MRLDGYPGLDPGPPRRAAATGPPRNAPMTAQPADDSYCPFAQPDCLFSQPDSARVPPEREEDPACSPDDLVRLLAQHDPLASSEFVINKEWHMIACLGPAQNAAKARSAAACTPARQRCREQGRLRRYRARAPGRSRTDTGDPFRGPASSLGLRGLGHDTPVGPNHSCSGE